jgi:hypothetical protein
MRAQTLLAGLALLALAAPAAAAHPALGPTPDPINAVVSHDVDQCLSFDAQDLQWVCPLLDQLPLRQLFRGIDLPFPHAGAPNGNCQVLVGLQVEMKAHLCTSRDSLGLCLYFDGERFDGVGVDDMSGGVIVHFPFVGPGEDGKMTNGTQVVGYDDDC